MLRIALLSCLVVAALAQLQVSPELNDDWVAYKNMFQKQYRLLGEDYMRRIIWERNLRLVNQHNLEESMGLHTYKLGMNEYADMEPAEFVKVMNGYRQQNVTRSTCGHFSSPLSVQDLPEEVDWTTKGYVTEIKNQGQCGSCWSFSATGSLEGQHFKSTGNLVSLSEKNLMDCSQAEGNRGCQGGLMDQAFEYIMKNNGIDTEESYPYKPKNGHCEFKRENVGATESKCTDISKGSESDLQKAVATIGPISVAIDASHASFQLYKSGVYNEQRCSSTRLDHGVLAVGYGTDNGKDYWLVKNSWGKSWGMEGYIKMSRNARNQCGISTAASFPEV